MYGFQRGKGKRDKLGGISIQYMGSQRVGHEPTRTYCIAQYFVIIYKAAVPNTFGTREQFCGRQFFHGSEWEMVLG